jgi:hypothetical protein
MSVPHWVVLAACIGILTFVATGILWLVEIFHQMADDGPVEIKGAPPSDEYIEFLMDRQAYLDSCDFDSVKPEQPAATEAPRPVGEAMARMVA